MSKPPKAPIVHLQKSRSARAWQKGKSKRHGPIYVALWNTECGRPAKRPGLIALGIGSTTCLRCLELQLVHARRALERCSETREVEHLSLRMLLVRQQRGLL